MEAMKRIGLLFDEPSTNDEIEHLEIPQNELSDGDNPHMPDTGHNENHVGDDCIHVDIEYENTNEECDSDVALLAEEDMYDEECIQARENPLSYEKYISE
ncbi:hypothetical protein JCGZ_24102 [Jatropha curcas]|uniref:Uncharacterized protein n=1 Tax=Jatropha curcas TaxID=180498 RepID=A0A067LHP2_JATCU|nr:hypothetical protein JCGZ_24102 [Jatropha curcas]